MKINNYDLDIVVQGFPGKSVCHGGLGWSSVVLLRAHDRIVLIDTGGFSMRTMLIKRFAERGLKPADRAELEIPVWSSIQATAWAGATALTAQGFPVQFTEAARREDHGRNK